MSDNDVQVQTEIAPQSFPEVPAYLQWTNRRRMAWVSLLSILALTIALVFYIPIPRIVALSDIIMWFYFTMSAVVGSYMGFTTLHATMASRKKT